MAKIQMANGASPLLGRLSQFASFSGFLFSDAPPNLHGGGGQGREFSFTSDSMGQTCPCPDINRLLARSELEDPERLRPCGR